MRGPGTPGTDGRSELREDDPPDAARDDKVTPHCREQYGQCVLVAPSVGVALTRSWLGSRVTAGGTRRYEVFTDLSQPG